MAPAKADRAAADLAAAALGRCPRCSKGTLFRQLVLIRDRCGVCGLDLSRFNVGDGAVVFLMMLLNIFVVAGILWLETAVQPPFWVHILIWPPAVLALTLLGLRVGKGLLLALEYRHDAAEGRLGP